MPKEENVQSEQGAVGIPARKLVQLGCQPIQALHELHRMAVSQYGIGLNLQVEPIRALIILRAASFQQVAGDLGTRDFSQRFAVTHQAVQTFNVGSVVRFRVGDVYEQSIATLFHGCQVVPGVDDERPFRQQHTVLVHEWKR